MKHPLTVLQRASIRYLGRHPWLAGLSIVGIALGVAVVVSIDLANSNAQRAFELSAARVAGKTTHQIVAPGTVDGEVYRQIRLQLGIRESAPVVEGYVTRAGRTFQALGIDPLADRPFRPYTSDFSGLDLGAFLGGGQVVLVPPSLSAEPGDTLHLSVGGRDAIVTVGGILVPDDEVSREALDNLLVMDVGSAQDLFRMGDELSRIDLILESSDEAALLNALPPGSRLVRSSTRTETVDQMTAAFELNLEALSLLALVVAMFLIYNTITFSVVQRRALLGRLRALGVTRRELFIQIVAEAAVLGLIGSVLGLLLGLALAQGLVRLVTQTINDLYYVLDVRSVNLDPVVLLKGLVLGVTATVVAALAPAREAASGAVSVVLQRSEEERSARRNLAPLAFAGIGMGAAAVLVLVYSGRNLTLSYIGLALVLGSFALLSPAATWILARAARLLFGAPFGLVGKMAAQGVAHNLSRTSVAIAALSIAVAAAVGVGVMVGSFRDTVVDWLDYTLQADLYVQPPSSVFRLGQGVLGEELVPRLEAIDSVESVSSVRRLELTIDSGPINLSAVDAQSERPSGVRFKEGDPSSIWNAFTKGRSILVSEPLAFRSRVEAGDSLVLPTDRGAIAFQVAGVYYDFGSDLGVATIRLDLFERFYDEDGLSGISIHAVDGADLSLLADRVRDAAAQDLIVRSNRGLREASLEVFDRSFAITAVLRLLALFVAFAGVLSALMSLLIERSGEFAILRAEGMTPAQLGRFMTLQTTLMGTIAGILALPLGTLLAYILVFVINKRSFGWTLQFEVPPNILLQSLAIAVGASVLAGLYPSWRAARARTADALRFE